MTSTTTLTILLVFSFMIGRFLRRFETPHFVFSGMIYLLFGLFVGSYMGLGLLNESLLYKLEPMRDFMTGVAGFLLGLRARYLFRNKKIFFSGLLTASFVFTLLVFALFLVSQFAVDFTDSKEILNTALPLPFLSFFSKSQLWFSFGVAATACSASLLSLGMISKFQKNSSEVTRALSILAPSLQFFAVSFLGICLAFARSDFSAEALDISKGQWIVATLCSGLLCGLIFSLFIGKQSNQNRVMLAALGAIIFASGIGTILNVSSMFVCFLTGVTISLFSTYAEILKKNLIRLEEPIFVLLLILGGATWQPQIDRAWLLPALYFLIRGAVLSSLTHVFYKNMTKRKLSRLGQGLLGQDLIAVAIALSLAKAFPELSQLFLTTILGSIFLNDIVANPLLKKVILDNEQSIEVQPIVKQEV